MCVCLRAGVCVCVCVCPGEASREALEGCVRTLFPSSWLVGVLRVSPRGASLRPQREGHTCGGKRQKQLSLPCHDNTCPPSITCSAVLLRLSWAAVCFPFVSSLALLPNEPFSTSLRGQGEDILLKDNQLDLLLYFSSSLRIHLPRHIY